MKRLLLLLLLITIIFFQSKNSLKAQSWPADTIHVNINSGNPKYPFPQFLEYNSGKTLAKNNAEGVTHADMEKTLREAYQIMMHRTLRVPGKVLNGVQYMVYNHSSVPENNNTFVSEGDGYALLAAAYFADKPTFDGLWLWIHDNRLSKVKRYWDCADLRAAYRYGANLPGWKNTEATGVGNGDNDSATDGDFDVAMGLLMAYMQWGEFMGINDACGTPINYRTEALNMMKAIVDTFRLNNLSGAYTGHMSGDIGIDGYCKNGNTWDEITSWRYTAANTAYPWAISKPEAFSQSRLYTDYMGPAYFNQFAKFLQANGGSAWQINQFLRGEASSDWLMGQMFAKGYVASSGNLTVTNDGSVTTFGPHPIEPGGEDFRASWRTILNYVWHGNPTKTWNPVTHQLVNTPNTYEHDLGLRHATYLKNPGTPVGTPFCKKLGMSPDLACPDYKGVALIPQAIGVTGTLGGFQINYNVGTGAAAAVASEDLALIADIYRQAEIMWDDASKQSTGLSDYQRYIGSTPVYFHDWFRVLGMLITSGNAHPPTSMLPSANMKVYMAVDKTYAYEGDILTYTVSYRNYGYNDATSVSIATLLDPDYQFVSASNGGTLTGSTITWNIGTVPGFRTATGITPTTGQVTFKVRVVQSPPNPRVCLTSTITASNAPLWTSNEYPNNATYTMERNCVDILTQRNLYIKKTVDRPVMNPGDISNFKLEFGNLSIPNSWLNGGRDQVIISYGNHNFFNTFYQFYRFWHSAQEAYINMHNYRVSYFMNDPAAIGLYNAATNPTGWDFRVDNQNDLDKYGYNPATGPITFSYQEIPYGTDADGSWNQRLVIRFANVLMSPSTHIFDKLDNLYLIHKGVWGPGFVRTKLESIPSSLMAPRLADDWSYSNTIDVNQIAAQDKRLNPITNGWANYNNLNVPITNYGDEVCNPDVPGFRKLLVEEFDGYTWRRIAGNGPLPGREAYNVIVTDTIPKDLQWNGFTDNNALGITATYTAAPGAAPYTGIVRWTIPVMLVGSVGDLAYQTIAKDPPCPAPDKDFLNVGWIQSQTDSPDSSRVNLRITCNPVPPTPPVETSLDKTASVANANIGDPVTYTLTYTNKEGSLAQWSNASTNAADWQVIGTNTTMPKINNATNFSFDQNDNTGGFGPGSNGYAFGNRKVHGVNGYIESTIDYSNSSAFSYFFRYTAGTPGQADFQGVRLEVSPNPMGNNTMSLKVFNNNTQIYTESNVSYGGSPDPINIRVQLVNDKMYIYINNFSGSPLKVISGITNLNAGYTGMFANGSQNKLTAWKGQFDSAFDVVLRDPVPASYGTPTAISNSGTLAAGVITWPTVAGPVLANQVITRTFTATVNTCTNFITNIGYAKVYGLPEASSQNVVYCGTALPVEWITLDAKRVETGIQLIWTVVEDSRHYGYVVERSQDGTFFSAINTFASPVHTTLYQYNYLDPQATGNLYYRIKHVNTDGTYSYSKVLFVPDNVNGIVQVFPTPTQHQVTIRVNNSEDFVYRVYSASGQLVERGTANQSVVIGEEYAQGVYTIQVVTGDEVVVKKLVKE
ncbi:MAG: glycosyl hydrolase family 8 [Cytophagaceae bacterium]